LIYLFFINCYLEFITPKDTFAWNTDKLIKPATEDKPEEELKSCAGGLNHLVRVVVPFEIKDIYCVIRCELSEAEIKKAEN
jgi:hypothetical protein